MARLASLRKIVHSRYQLSLHFPWSTRGSAEKLEAVLPPWSRTEAVRRCQQKSLFCHDDISVSEATDMLWRRETRKTGGEKYAAESVSAKSVLVREIDTPWVSTVLYTDFPCAGKMDNPTVEELARCAIQSVANAGEGLDGISYLMNARACGIETPLTPAYMDEILKQTKTKSLDEALAKTKAKSANNISFATEQRDN